MDRDDLPEDERPPVTDILAEASWAALAVCKQFGHCFEGRLVGRRAVGRCARCGVGIITDGSGD